VVAALPFVERAEQFHGCRRRAESEQRLMLGWR
jgi:hypothetical protein